MEGKQLRAEVIALALIIDGLGRVMLSGNEVWLPTCVGIWLDGWGWMLLREAGY